MNLATVPAQTPKTHGTTKELLDEKVRRVGVGVSGFRRNFRVKCRGREAGPSVATKKSAAYTDNDDIIYGRKYGMALTMNLLNPANPNGAVVLWVISSGFFSSHEETLNPGFVSRVEPLLDRGYTVFLVMHASAPQFELREVNKDIHRAVRFVRSHAGDYGFDPQGIGITGSSAGGYLASWLGTTGWPAMQPQRIRWNARRARFRPWRVSFRATIG